MPKPTSAHKCRDCRMMPELPKTPRPLSKVDPQRCVSHAREKAKQNKAQAAIRRREVRFALTAQDQDELWRFQGFQCAGCGARPGPRAKRPAVDHDHSICGPDKHPGDRGCHVCVRGLICYRCNTTLAAYRDNPHKLRQLADYLDNPPWQALRNPPESRGER